MDKTTAESVVAELRASKSCSTEGHENKNEHGRSGLCQACYRRQRRRELDPEVGQRKPGPAPREGAVSHKRQSDEEKVARRALRLEEYENRQTCVNGHPWVEDNLYRQPGQDAPKCRLCLRHAQQRHKNRPLTEGPLAPTNAEKTHCRWGHEYVVHGRVKADGARMCVPCHRESTLMRTYGFARGQYDAMHAKQGGCCVICRRKLEEGKNLHVDHDHATGVVRGLLCTSCNNGLGRFDDDPALFDVAAAYIRRHRVDAKTS